MLLLTYATLRDSAMVAATARLNRAADQLGTLASRSTAQLRARVAGVAADPVLLGALREPAAGAGDVAPADAPRVRAALARLLSPADTGLSVELWAEDGRRVAFAGRDLRTGRDHGIAGPEAAGGFALPPGLDSLAASDSARMGELYLVDTVPHFWVVAPVVEDGRRLGYVARPYRIAEGPRAEETIRGLTGAEVRSYYRTPSGDVWTTIAGGRASPPMRGDSVSGAALVHRPDAGALLAVEERVAGTPLVIALERPMDDVLATTRGTMRQLALVSLFVLLLGTLAAWAMSRRITRPLVALTGAADAVAAGDYRVRVRPAGDAELTRLAESFNHMAAEVGATSDELETQTEEAQAIAEELEASNRELGEALAELEGREAELRALADSMPQLAWMAGDDGTLLWCNARWHAYTGIPRDAALATAWRSTLSPDELPRVAGGWQHALATGEPFELQCRMRAADGAYRWFLTRAQPVRDASGRVARWFGTNTDVQELHDARDAAERARLDAEQARRQADEARDRAESASRAKSDFLAVMSHELRTPLNAIGGYTELLELELRGPVTDAQRRDLERIRTNQQHLLGLVSGVLDLGRIEARRVAYDLERLLVDPMLASLESLIGPQAAAKSLALGHRTLDARLAVLADREKLRQILLNLLSNAVRYTPAGGRIEIEASPAEGGTVRIAVRDTGPGIAADAQERIFEPFVQLDRSLTQGRDGVGLGLAISRDLARGMGGDITVESTPGAGSTFTLVLPRADVTDADVAATTSGEHAAADHSRAVTRTPSRILSDGKRIT